MLLGLVAKLRNCYSLKSVDGCSSRLVSRARAHIAQLELELRVRCHAPVVAQHVRVEAAQARRATAQHAVDARRVGDAGRVEVVAKHWTERTARDAERDERRERHLGDEEAAAESHVKAFQRTRLKQTKFSTTEIFLSRGNV